MSTRFKVLNDPQETNQMQRWEYAILSADGRNFTFFTESGQRSFLDADTLSVLSPLGDEGWEMTGASEHQCGVMYWYFKRPRGD